MRTHGEATLGVDQDTIPSVEFDPTSPDFTRDPYPYYRRLREETPIARMPGNFLLVSGHRDCFQILRDPIWNVPPNLGCVSEREGSGYDNPNFGGLRTLFEDPDTPDDGAERSHVRRVLVAKAFSRNGANEIKDRVVETVGNLLDEAMEAGEVDMVGAFTAPFVHDIGCDLLGIPAKDRADVRRWVSGLGAAIDPLYKRSDEEGKRLAQLGREFREYMAALLVYRRRHPGADLLSHLMAVEEDGERLSEAGVVAMCCIIAMAATETSINFLSLAIWSLLRNPGELARFREDTGIAPRAVEELLRYDTQIHFVSRLAAEDTVLGGHRIPKGQYAFVLTAAANRDAAVFYDPERLDLTRDPNPHLAFAPGRHHCTGAAFAQVEARFALSTLVRRVPNLALAGEPEVRQRFNNRSLARLPVSLR